MNVTRLSLTAAISFVLFSASAMAQVEENETTDASKIIEKMQTSRQPKADQQLEKLPTIPMEGPIDVSMYVLGPSDVLEFGIWGPLTLSQTLVVTPEGSLILPTIGEVQVAGVTLLEAKQTVLRVTRRKYPVGDVTLTLMRPRTFLVSLQGIVMRPGQYLSNSVERVEKVLLEGIVMPVPNASYSIPAVSPRMDWPYSEDVYDLPSVNQTVQLYDDASTRNIKLIRRNGDTVHVDIPKFHATGKSSLNPFLRDGDLIFVPRRDLTRSSVSVSGAVNSPGVIEYSEGDSVLDLVRISGGWTSGANLDSVVIRRRGTTGVGGGIEKVSIAGVMNGTATDLPVFPGDRIIVPLKDRSAGVFRVLVLGEVGTPGPYSIVPNVTTLTDVLGDAGGVTGNALLSASFVLRNSSPSEEVTDDRTNFLQNIRSHEVSATDSLYFFQNLRRGKQPVSVDLAALLTDQDTTEDVLLQDGDIVFIESNDRSILVLGQVSKPGYVPFEPGKDFLHYIQLAGGFSELAVESDTRVIKGGTLEWIDAEGAVIESGDQIWVPKDRIRNSDYYVRMIRDYAQIASAIAGTAYFIALIINLSK